MCNKLAERSRLDAWVPFCSEKSLSPLPLRRASGKLSRAFYIRTWAHCRATLKSTNERSLARTETSLGHIGCTCTPLYLRWHLTKTRESAQYRDTGAAVWRWYSCVVSEVSLVHGTNLCLSQGWPGTDVAYRCRRGIWLHPNSTWLSATEGLYLSSRSAALTLPLSQQLESRPRARNRTFGLTSGPLLRIPWKLIRLSSTCEIYGSLSEAPCVISCHRCLTVKCSGKRC